ncbi:hypothetical protein HDC35_000250 [Sphingopyxis sp. JAI128]|nr:hypothetical protein [Sphingopyxis sp. JAI128]
MTETKRAAFPREGRFFCVRFRYRPIPRLAGRAGL